ncbi:ATP-binding protein [Mesomycoplasma bovoculi]|uniref:Putative transcriptional regulator n=1 Tax=Mesomycoplasma bovoculi M165/69 TaxID=743966 RepID=W5USW4_9BACT|nr:ATP-binding protein [Mesomycoplasma bovoculi]AHH45206.1 putative transcriptional regulator [Mesomycoplasma bovoculi M165/69]
MGDKDFCISLKYKSESLKLELKSQWILNKAEKNRKILNTISAFLNTKGGTLVIGITDEKREIIGISNNIEEIKKIKGDIELLF